MQVDVGTSEVELDTSDYPDSGAKGQVLILQNLGAGDIYFDFLTGVDSDSGIKVAAGGGYEVANWGPGSKLFVIASASSTDLRYAVVG
jgi:hypothetical protein